MPNVTIINNCSKTSCKNACLTFEMLQKYAKPAHRRYIKTGAKVLFVAEALAFAFSYGVWYKLNRDRDFRLYMHNNCSYILDGYYKIGELLDSGNECRSLDLSAWRKEGKVSG